MEQMRGYVYRLFPTSEQTDLLRSHAGVCRLVYNLALEQRRVWGKRRRITAFDQIKELKFLRAEFNWIAAVSQTAQTQAILDLDKAFVNFFAGRAAFPSPRRRGENDSFRFNGREIATRRLNRRWSEIRLPKIGWVRYRDTRPLVGTVRETTVSLGPLGWQVSVLCRREVAVPERLPGSVGIDRGVTVPLMLSTGEAMHLPTGMIGLERLHRRAQRVASRRKRGSRRHAKAMHRARQIKSRIARIRSHWQHEVTTRIARRFGTVAVEALSTRNMTRSARGTIDAPGRNVRQKSGLNHAILNVGWAGIETKLAYKLAERGGLLVRVDPAFTSQTCSACGTVDSRGRESQSSFVCPACGFRTNADWNAAINIEVRGNTADLDVEGRRLGLPAKRQLSEAA
jgi:putative transposase